MAHRGLELFATGDTGTYPVVFQCFPETIGIIAAVAETHRKNIKRKLGISSTAGLTRYALEHGVLQGTGML